MTAREVMRLFCKGNPARRRYRHLYCLSRALFSVVSPNIQSTRNIDIMFSQDCNFDFAKSSFTHMCVRIICWYIRTQLPPTP